MSNTKKCINQFQRISVNEQYNQISKYY